jgi:hypothetical protein
MNTGEPTSNANLGAPHSHRSTVLVLCGLLVCLAFVAVVLNWQTDYLLSPRYTLRIIDNARMPIPGVLVVHEWGLSVTENGEDKARTDTNGVVRFDPVAVEMSMLRRLLIKVLPVTRGLGYENYSSARCRIYLPEGSTVDLTENTRGAFIRIIDRSHRLLAQAAQYPGMGIPPLPPPNSPQGDHIDLFFATGVNEFELHVR